MKDSELSSDIRALISTAVPTLDALELLILLARHPGQIWTLDQLGAAIPQLSSAELRAHLSLFVASGLVPAGEGVTLAPNTAALGEAIAGLCRAYNERPVTLIRTVYAIADERKIQSFADAFRLKRDS